MSLKKSSTRRVALFTSSSLIAASLTALAFTGAALAPTLAYAYDECVPANPPVTLSDGPNGVSDPTLNGATPDSFACSAATYATGITYSSAGHLTVTKTNTGVTTVTANGVNLTGNGADSVTWDSSAGGVTGGAGTAGPVIDVTSVSGPISIITNAVTATQAGTTHGVRAVSSGAGNITTVGSVNNNSAAGQAAIYASTQGGNISITTAQGFTTGNERGIVAQTSGAGSVTLNLAGSIRALTAGSSIAAVDATAGTGGISINITNGATTSTGVAIRAATTGSLTINNTGSGAVGTILSSGVATNGAVDFSGVAGGVTFNNVGGSTSTGVWGISGNSVFSAGNDILSMSGIGISRIADGASVNFAGGNDTFNLSARLVGGAGTLDFGAGADTFNLSGLLVVNETAIEGLEAFNNSGTLYMGGAFISGAFASDGRADDVFAPVAAGGVYTGSGSGRIVMDVLFQSDAVQADCAALSGFADCLDLRGAASAGVTMLTINYIGDEAEGASFDPVGLTVVDVAGGTSGAGHFVLDPESDGYAEHPLFGGTISRPGLFSYALRYDAETLRHALVGLPRVEVLNYAILPSLAQTIWQLTSETVTDRQTQRRDGNPEGAMWLRTSGEVTRRDVASNFTIFGDTFAIDNSYKLHAGTIIGGIDLISGESASAQYVLGAQIGYVSSNFDMDEMEASGRFTGATGGVYGSLWNDWFFVDGTVNLNGLTLDYSSPGLGSKTNTYVNTVGARFDSGTRMMLTENTFAEPLATLAWSRTSFEEISLSGAEIQPADAESLRGALGLRLGATLPGENVSATWFATGRAWYEWEGESSGVVHNAGTALPFTDEFTGGFGEAELGVNVFNTANTLSGFLTSGVKFKDGYSAVNLSLGVRMAW